jgi:purine-binding chemotaxis protein CheW
MIAAGETQAERRERVLRERAERIARRDDEAAASDRLEVLVFRLLSESYAVETRYIREVLPLRNLAALPCTPAFYLGLINIRGELCPVIDLRRLFNQPNKGVANASRIIVLSDGRLEVGIVADSIEGAQALPEDSLRPLAGVSVTIHEEFLRGCVPDNVVVIDAARLLAHPRLIVNEQVEA